MTPSKPPLPTDDRVAPRARGFFLRGGRVGVLLLHGFGGSIDDLRMFGAALAERGCTVLGVRLAGHGTNTDDLHRSTADDWLASARNGLAMLQAQTETIVAIGESMGALLALRLARESTIIAGLVLLAPPLTVRDERMRAVLSRVLPPGLRRRKPWLDERRAALNRAKGSLLEVTVGSYRQFLRLLQVERAALSGVHVPVLAVFAQGDYATDRASLDVLTAAVPEPRRTVLTLPESIHHVAESKDLTRVLKAVTTFVERVTRQPSAS